MCSEFQTLMQAPACTFTKPAMKAAIGGYGDFCWVVPVVMHLLTCSFSVIFRWVKKAPESQHKMFENVRPAEKVPGSTDRRLSTLRLPVLSYDAAVRRIKIPSCIKLQILTDVDKCQLRK